jgi:nitrogen fixation/metabolism regulation signal transduction histidine kinase
MVNTFSDYARMPAINQERTDLNKLILAVVDLYRSANPEARFELDFAADLPAISVDASRLRQVFNNLVKNALEASSDRSKAVILLSTRRLHTETGDYFTISILDRGDGIPPEMLTNIFEPYVTSKTRGTGLGLAIVKKIIEEHGGVVTLENDEDGGARATIRLPLVADPKAQRSPA